MKVRAADFLVYDNDKGVYVEDPEQIVRDDVEKHYWRHVILTIAKDWRLYLMLVPMLLVFLLWRYFPMYELLGYGTACLRAAFLRLLLLQETAFRGRQHVNGILESPQEHLHHQLLRPVLRLPNADNPGPVLQ